MATNYYVILTKQGKELLANALANESILDFTQMAVGDGGGSSYEPDENQTALRNETYRSAISSMKVNEQDSNVLEFEFVVPASSGGYYIREAGLFAGETLVAVAKMGDNYKPEIIEGAGSSMTIRFMLAINNEYNAVINISESIEYATKTYVNEKIEEALNIRGNRSFRESYQQVDGRTAILNWEIFETPYKKVYECIGSTFISKANGEFLLKGPDNEDFNKGGEGFGKFYVREFFMSASPTDNYNDYKLTYDHIEPKFISSNVGNFKIYAKIICNLKG